MARVGSWCGQNGSKWELNYTICPHTDMTFAAGDGKVKIKKNKKYEKYLLGLFGGDKPCMVVNMLLRVVLVQSKFIISRRDV